MKIAFITNICSHYTVGTFEILAQYFNIDFYFYSAGDEWYWQKAHGSRTGKFHSEYLPGFYVGKTRITLSLIWKLISGKYDVFIKCINGKFALPASFIIAKLMRKPFILWTGIWTRINTPFHRLFFPITLFVYRHSDAIVVYGEHVKEYLVSEGIPSEKIFVAVHAVNNDFYNKKISGAEITKLRENLGIGKDEKIVLFLGRLEEIKGIQYLLEAFSLLKRQDVTLIIAGDGSLKQQLIQQTEQLNINHKTHFVGYVAPEDAVPYYAAADVLVLPSVSTRTGKELWGLVVNEAMNQGMPVIATTAVGAAAGGLVQNDINGFIIPERDSNAIADSLNKILDNPDLRLVLAQNALNTVANWNYIHGAEGYIQAINYANR